MGLRITSQSEWFYRNSVHCRSISCQESSRIDSTHISTYPNRHADIPLRLSPLRSAGSISRCVLLGAQGLLSCNLVDWFCVHPVYEPRFLTNHDHNPFPELIVQLPVTCTFQPGNEASLSHIPKSWILPHRLPKLCQHYTCRFCLFSCNISRWFLWLLLQHFIQCAFTLPS